MHQRRPPYPILPLGITLTMSSPPLPAASPLPPPPWPLAPGESVLVSSRVEYLDRCGWGYLTNHRIMLKATQPNANLQTRIDSCGTPQERDEFSKPLQFQLPLTTLTGHFVSPATNLSKLMLKVTYQIPNTMGTPVTPPSSVIWRFNGTEALADRTRWKEVLVERQAAANAPAAATPASATPTPNIVVKKEPTSNATNTHTTQPATHTPSAAPTAPAAPTPTPAPAAIAAAPPRPAATAGGHKRPHSAMSAPAHPAPPAASPLTGADLQSLIRVRAALLARDPSLQSVHAELVPMAVSEEEFWSSRGELIRQEQSRQGSHVAGYQRAGISSTMASTIRPETGCNTVKYTLDASQIHAIFLENPMVYELYQQLVPSKLDEKTFWTKYFKSQYLHSQSTSSQSLELSKQPHRQEEDLFAQVNKLQEEQENAELATRLLETQQTNNRDGTLSTAQLEAIEKKDLATKATLLQRRIDPSVDLTAADLTNAVLLADPSKSSGSSAPMSNTTRSKKARAQTELLQRFNRHGMLVLDSGVNGQTNNNINGAGAASVGTEQTIQTTYHTQLAHSLDLVDLAVEPTPSYNTLPIGVDSFASLGARKMPSAAASSSSQPTLGHEDEKSHAERLLRYRQAFQHELADTLSYTTNGPDVRRTVNHLPPSGESRSILLELTSTARGMNKAAIAAKQLREESGQQLIVFSTGNEPDMLIPDQFRDELKKRYHTCNELFRHFWSSLNIRTNGKLQRVHAALDEQHRLLQVIRTSLNSRGYSQLVPLLNPLVTSIEMCSQTHAKWIEKESKRISAAQTQGGAVGPTNPIRRANNMATNPNVTAATTTTAPTTTHQPTQSTPIEPSPEPESKRTKL